MPSSAARLFLAGTLVVTVAADPGKDETEPEKTPQRIEALGLQATFDLPPEWAEHIDTGDGGFKDPKTRAGLLEAKRLPNEDFEVERGWNNTGEVLAQMRLRLGRKEFRGTRQELAALCVTEIRAKWPGFKATKPVEKAITLGSTPALQVTLENKKEPPYRVQFVVLVLDGKGCGLFCYGWGPVVNVVDHSGGQMPDSARKFAEQARRLSPEKLKRQAEIFREFETKIVPTLRVARPPPAPPPVPPPGSGGR
jgi:hypothetical protein